MSELKFDMKVRTALRPLRSNPTPDLIMKGYDPIVVITFPNIGDKDADTMILDVDATGFDPLELAGMLHAASMAIMKGVRTDVDRNGASGDISDADLAWAKGQLPDDDDLGESDPDGGSK